MRAHLPTTTATLAVALALLACCPDDADPLMEGPEESEITGGRLYRLSPGPCDDCSVLTLSRVGASFELRADLDGAYVGNTLATLRADEVAALDEMIEAIAAIESGQQELGQPGGQVHGGTLAQLWLPGLTLSYARGFPPTGLVELDDMLGGLVDDISSCAVTDTLDYPEGCEPL